MYFFKYFISLNFRREGLVWIIKAIWNLGHKVSPAYLPSFLDEQLISYLFNVKNCYLKYFIKVLSYRCRIEKDKKKIG